MMAHPNLEDLSLHDEEEEGFCFDFEEVEDEQVELSWNMIKITRRAFGDSICESESKLMSDYR
jgi:hypothetical protein